ncbi:MAG: PH domain-containing protein, partial [Bacteroidota bacterium]|nr:PH domain-containing protein [Bacteroidota bacterium]
YDKLECELTFRTLRFRKGILFQVEKTIPLENIQDLTFIEGPLLKHFNLCILKVETAGQGDFHGNQMKLIGIKDATIFREQVLEQRRLINAKREHSNEDVLLEIKNTLQRIEEILSRPK